MARIHRGIVGGVALVVGGAFLASWLLGGTAQVAWRSLFEDDEPVKVEEPPPGFSVSYAPEPRAEAEKAEPEKRETIRERIASRQATTEQKSTGATSQQAKKETLTDAWLKTVNKGEMYSFGEDNGYTGNSGGAAGCSILQPVRVRAMIADAATTDTPGMAIGFTVDDVQGQRDDGEWCLAIPALSLTSFHVQKAGDYATNRVPTQVGEIWLEDGFKVSVDQPAKHIDGSIGVIGKANHHTLSKALAGGLGGLFRLADNVTSIGQFGTRSSDVTDPFEETIRKRLERPSEITFMGNKVAEFDLLPTSTPGYD